MQETGFSALSAGSPTEPRKAWNGWKRVGLVGNGLIVVLEKLSVLVFEKRHAWTVIAKMETFSE